MPEHAFLWKTKFLGWTGWSLNMLEGRLQLCLSQQNDLIVEIELTSSSQKKLVLLNAAGPAWEEMTYINK